MLMERVKRYRSTFIISAPAIPDLEPYDSVTVTESITGISKAGYIANISEQFSGGAYTASYEILDATDWLIDGDYFEIGSSTVTSASGSDYIFH